MAAITPVTITLNAKDWETIIGITFPCSDPELQNVFFQVQNYYSAQATKPKGTDPVAVNTTEDIVVKIATYLFGTNLNYSHNDANNTPFNRIMTVLRAANNTADNYIANQFATFDSNVSTIQQTIRKNGRKYIMILQYDNQ